MNDYRPLLSNIAQLIEELIDSNWVQSSFTKEEALNMLEELNDLFAEMDDELGG